MQYTDLECTVDTQRVLVLDTGSESLRLGFSGEDAPRLYQRSIVGLSGDENGEFRDDVRSSTGSSNTATSGLSKRIPVYGSAASSLPRSSIISPIIRGNIVDKDRLESLWEHCIRTRLNIDQTPTVPVLVAVAPQTSNSVKEWIAEMFLEKLNFPALSIANSAALSLYSTGHTSGFVLEIGHGLSSAVPVFEGFAIPYASSSLNVAGGDATLAFKAYFEEISGISSSQETAAVMKEKFAFVRGTRNFQENHNFQLPDGTVVKIPENVCTATADIFFPKFGPSLSEISKKSFSALAPNLQAELAGNLQLAGAGSLLSGLGPRLQAELGDDLPGLRVHADGQRKHSAWLGGSMFGSLSTFSNFSLKKKEYEEGNASELVAQRLN